MSATTLSGFSFSAATTSSILNFATRFAASRVFNHSSVDRAASCADACGLNPATAAVSHAPHIIAFENRIRVLGFRPARRIPPQRSSGLGGLLVEHVPLWAILFFDAATYLTSFLIQSTLPYTATHLAASTPNVGPALVAGPSRAERDIRDGLPTSGSPTASPRAAPPSHPGVWQSVAEGWRWLRDRPRLTVFLTCSLLPFVVVMAGNYIFPIYVSQTLHAGAGWFAGGEIAFALGTVLVVALVGVLRSRSALRAFLPAHS